MKRKWFIALLAGWRFVLYLSSNMYSLRVLFCSMYLANGVDRQSRVEKLPPPVINRKIPSPPHCKMLQAPTLAGTLHHRLNPKKE